MWLTVQDFGNRHWGLDSHAYWSAWRGPMYDHAPNTFDAYLYSPAFAQALWPAVQLPWPVFGVLWAALVVAGLVHLFRPLGWAWVVPLVLCCAPEIVAGNIFWLLALVAAYGARWPGLWAVALLTKLTPGIGLLWFAVRREWRPLAVALLTTACVVVVSFALDPALWRAWVDMLVSNASSSGSAQSALIPPLLVRLPVAVVLLAWTALTDRPWGLPAAMVLATPVTGVAAFVLLAALPRLHRETPAARPRRRTAAHRTPVTRFAA